MPDRPLWSAEDVAAATGGQSRAPFSAHGVSIDSRTVARDDLFVALRGPNFDGHDYVADALDRGAAAAVVARVPAAVAARETLVLVPDSEAALDGLARWARRRSRARVIAVTGSMGKTSTKEMLARLLAPQGSTMASLGNLNNRWGVPLSLARLPADTAYAVFELAMNHAGEIAPLARMVRPEVGIITTIAPVHVAHFASTFEIAEAKAELFLGMAGGIAVLNRDNPYFAYLASAAEAAGAARVIGFGAHPDAAARLIRHEPGPTSSEVVATIGETQVRYRLPMAGRHWVMNSLAVLAAVAAVGGEVVAAARDFRGMEPLDGRGKRHRIRLGRGSFELIDDSYNASPASMRAAFEVLAAARPGARGRRVAVLGDMLELGARSKEMHRALAPAILREGIDCVYAAGPDMLHLFRALPKALRGGHRPTSRELAPLIIDAVREGDVVSVKGSHGSRMEHVVEALRRLDERPARATGT